MATTPCSSHQNCVLSDYDGVWWSIDSIASNIDPLLDSCTHPSFLQWQCDYIIPMRPYRLRCASCESRNRVYSVATAVWNSAIEYEQRILSLVAWIALCLLWTLLHRIPCNLDAKHEILWHYILAYWLVSRRHHRSKCSWEYIRWSNASTLNLHVKSVIGILRHLGVSSFWDRRFGIIACISLFTIQHSAKLMAPSGHVWVAIIYGDEQVYNSYHNLMRIWRTGMSSQNCLCNLRHVYFLTLYTNFIAAKRSH